jgi:LmbE family N-acetylglucosaminyl deacetylase
MNEQTHPLDVIAVGAHPDDCEIGCGGTLATLVKQGFSVGIIDLTDGEPTPGCDDPAIRLQEAQAAAKALGVQKRIVLDLPNRRLFDSFEARVELAKQFRIYQPKIVLGLGGKTPMASPDHWQAAQITDAAVFYSRLCKWDDFFDGLPVHTVARQLHYHLFFESDWSGIGAKQFVHDVSESIELKLAAVRCYETQFPPAKGYVFERVRSIAAAVGASAGFEFGEVLTSTRSIGSTNLFDTLQLPGG